MTGLKACGNITTRQDAGIRAQCITLYARTLTKGFPATQLSPMEPCWQKKHSRAWQLVESLWERNHMSQALELKCIITPYTRSLAHGFPASRLSPTEPCRQKKHSRARRLVESLWERNHMSQALELKCIITPYTRSLAHHRKTMPSEKLWGSNENLLQTTKLTNTVTKLDVCGETLDVSTLEEEEEEDPHNKGGSLSDVSDCTTSWSLLVHEATVCCRQCNEFVPTASGWMMGKIGRGE